MQDVNDVLTAIDLVIDMGLADPSKICVLGGSHGGFLSTHLIGQVNSSSVYLIRVILKVYIIPLRLSEELIIPHHPRYYMCCGVSIRRRYNSDSKSLIQTSVMWPPCLCSPTLMLKIQVNECALVSYYDMNP